MTPRVVIYAAVVLAGLSGPVAESHATVFQLNSPASYVGPRNTISFEGYADQTAANNLYQGQGITFARDDGRNVFIENVTSRGWTTVSGSNTLATTGNATTSWTYVTHLNVYSSTPLQAAGAFFGNDQTIFGTSDFTSIRLSIYDASEHFLGSVGVTANQNSFIDQFVGLQSDTPFTHIRFENLTSAATPSSYFSVLIDDFTYAAVPEPGCLQMLGASLAIFVLRRRTR
jgi:hypothetical protein